MCEDDYKIVLLHRSPRFISTQAPQCYIGPYAGEYYAQSQILTNPHYRLSYDLVSSRHTNTESRYCLTMFSVIHLTKSEDTSDFRSELIERESLYAIRTTARRCLSCFLHIHLRPAISHQRRCDQWRSDR